MLKDKDEGKCGQYFTKAPQSKFYEDCILL